MTMENLYNVTYALCFCHQIVPMCTSIPTPLYVADEYAKRGRNNYNANQALREDNFAIDLNEVLTYGRLECRSKRVNA